MKNGFTDYREIEPESPKADKVVAGKKYTAVPSWLAKQTITTTRNRIVVGEFVVQGEAAESLFNQDREDGPFIVRIGGANIVEENRRLENFPAEEMAAIGDLSDDERKEYEAWKALPDDERKAKPMPEVERFTSDGKPLISETKQPAQNVLLNNGTVTDTYSWVEFEDGQRFFAPVKIEERKDAPVSHRPRGAWWQRAIKKANELPGKSKDERFGQLVGVCEKAADMEMDKPEDQWWIDYLPDDHRNKEKNPRKLMIGFVHDWKTAKMTTKGAREFRRKKTMWLMKQVYRAQKKSGEGR